MFNNNSYNDSNFLFFTYILSKEILKYTFFGCDDVNFNARLISI